MSQRPNYNLSKAAKERKDCRPAGTRGKKKNIFIECNLWFFRGAQHVLSCLATGPSALMTGKLTLTCKIGQVPL